MKTVLLPLAVFLVAVASVILSELTMMAWLGIAPFDVTGNFLLLGIIPVEFVVVSIASLILWKAHKRNTVLYMGLYWAIFAAAHAVELSNLGNPDEDIIKYLASITLACLVWFFILRRKEAA